MYMLDDRYGPNGDPPRFAGRKGIKDYIGGVVGISMLIGSIAIVAGVLLFSSAVSPVTRTVQYNQPSKHMGVQ
jgi:hypothetical protein